MLPFKHCPLVNKLSEEIFGQMNFHMRKSRRFFFSPSPVFPYSGGTITKTAEWLAEKIDEQPGPMNEAMHKHQTLYAFHKQQKQYVVYHRVSTNGHITVRKLSHTSEDIARNLYRCSCDRSCWTNQWKQQLKRARLVARCDDVIRRETARVRPYQSAQVSRLIQNAS